MLINRRHAEDRKVQTKTHQQCLTELDPALSFQIIVSTVCGSNQLQVKRKI